MTDDYSPLPPPHGTLDAPPQRLVLERPLCIFDLETTGLDLREDRIVEVSLVKIAPDYSRQVKTWRINPERPIPKRASDVHHIYDEDVRDAPIFSDLASSIMEFIGDSDLGGFNVDRFDIPILRRELNTCGHTFPAPGARVVDSQQIFFKCEPRHLQAAYRFYCDATLDNAHSAEADAMATADILLAQVNRYTDLSNDIEGLSRFCAPRKSTAEGIDPAGKIGWKGDVAVLTFGKHRDRALKDLVEQERGYLEWMQGERASFEPATKAIIRDALGGDLPRK